MREKKLRTDEDKVERIAEAIDGLAAAVDRHTAEYARYRKLGLGLVRVLGAGQLSKAQLVQLARLADIR